MVKAASFFEGKHCYGSRERYPEPKVTYRQGEQDGEENQGSDPNAPCQCRSTLAAHWFKVGFGKIHGYSLGRVKSSLRCGQSCFSRNPTVQVVHKVWG